MYLQYQVIDRVWLVLLVWMSIWMRTTLSKMSAFSNGGQPSSWPFGFIDIVWGCFQLKCCNEEARGCDEYHGTYYDIMRQWVYVLHPSTSMSIPLQLMVLSISIFIRMNFIRNCTIIRTTSRVHRHLGMRASGGNEGRITETSLKQNDGIQGI